MFKTLNATKKGLITGLLMIALTLVLFYSKLPYDTPLQYFIFIIYALGVVWALYGYSRQDGHEGKFGQYFSQGFKCFIVVTLLMVLFTALFYWLHPEFKAEAGIAYREELKNTGNATPAEIDAAVKKFQDFYTVMRISGAIFVNLMIGAAVSLVGSLLYARPK